jgi:hypothetical protein
MFLLFILSNKSYVCVDFYLQLNLINKFIKHNQLNYPHYNIKYLHLYLFISFFYFFYKKITNQKWVCWGVFLSFLLLLKLTLFLDYFFFSYSKKIVSNKSFVIKLYKVHWHIHSFDWLTWFACLMNLTFFSF